MLSVLVSLATHVANGIMVHAFQYCRQNKNEMHVLVWPWVIGFFCSHVLHESDITWNQNPTMADEQFSSSLYSHWCLTFGDSKSLEGWMAPSGPFDLFHGVCVFGVAVIYCMSDDRYKCIIHRLYPRPFHSAAFMCSLTLHEYGTINFITQWHSCFLFIYFLSSFIVIYHILHYIIHPSTLCLCHFIRLSSGIQGTWQWMMQQRGDVSLSLMSVPRPSAFLHHAEVIHGNNRPICVEINVDKHRASLSCV